MSLILDALKRKSSEHDAKGAPRRTARTDAVLATLGYPRSDQSGLPLKTLAMFGGAALAIGFVGLSLLIVLSRRPCSSLSPAPPAQSAVQRLPGSPAAPRLQGLLRRRPSAVRTAARAGSAPAAASGRSAVVPGSGSNVPATVVAGPATPTGPAPTATAAPVPARPSPAPATSVPPTRAPGQLPTPAAPPTAATVPPSTGPSRPAVTAAPPNTVPSRPAGTTAPPSTAPSRPAGTTAHQARRLRDRR